MNVLSGGNGVVTKDKSYNRETQAARVESVVDENKENE